MFSVLSFELALVQAARKFKLFFLIKSQVLSEQMCSEHASDPAVAAQGTAPTPIWKACSREPERHPSHIQDGAVLPGTAHSGGPSRVLRPSEPEPAVCSQRSSPRRPSLYSSFAIWSQYDGDSHSWLESEASFKLSSSRAPWCHQGALQVSFWSLGPSGQVRL